MIEISVVLPQPLGPMRSVRAPHPMSTSMPWRTRVRVSPLPNSFAIARQATPTAGRGPGESGTGVSSAVGMGIIRGRRRQARGEAPAAGS